ncbi:phosphate regulon sensor protein PhoR [Fibrobacteria bacterium R8-3-H12]
MVRRIASLAVPLKLLLFLAGILLATMALAFIGYGRIKNEEWIAEKNYESAKTNLRISVMETLKKEEEKLVGTVKTFVSNEDFLQDSLPSGIISLYIFKDGTLHYPKLDEESTDEIYLLENSEALALKEFLDLQKAKKFAEAGEYALQRIDSFLQNPLPKHLDWNDYFFERMLNDILSEENLSKAEREKFWKKLSETKRLLQNLSTYRDHRDFLLALGNYASYSNEGYFFIKDKSEFFLAIPYLDMAVKSAIIAKVDSTYYTKKISGLIKETAKEWSYIPYFLSGEYPFGKWEILIDEDKASVRKESKKWINFLSLILVFSLIIPVIGVVVVYRGFSQERRLRFMKDNFLSTISHELKTPLTSIKMYSELMNSGRVNKPEKIISHTGVILKETSRLENLIDAILNYTRMESGKQVFRWETLNLSECANKVCDSLDVIAKSKGLEIKKEIEENVHIIGDYSSIYSLIQNLVDNAIKYTAEGYVFVKLQAVSQGVSLSVEDTGKGIPAPEQKNIFEGFYRVGDESTRETKGSGLGLAIVKRTSDAHKASIILKSSPGKGSTFTVVFKQN